MRDVTSSETLPGSPLEAFRGQQDILTPADLAGGSVDIVGAGALEGAILLCLCKMGFGITNTLTVTDFDRSARRGVSGAVHPPGHPHIRLWAPLRWNEGDC